MKAVTRRDVIKLGAAALGGTALASSGMSFAAPSKGVVDITYDWTYNGPPGKVAEFWRTVQARLEQQDHGVRLGQLSETTFENLNASVQAQLRAKSGSDMATWYADYITYRQAYLSDFAPVNEVTSAETRSHWLLNDSSMFNGQHWGHPMMLEVATLVVNRRLFEKAGVEVGERFESYDAFIEACEKLKRAGITPIQAGTSDGFNAEKWLYFLQLQKCDNITDLLGGISGTLSLDAPYFKFPREELPRLAANYMNPAPHNDTEEMATNKFMKGGAAMMLMYLTPIVQPDTPSEFDVVGFPGSDARFNRPAVGVANNLIIPTYSNAKQEVGRLFDFLAQPEQVNLWWELCRTLPASDSLDASKLPAPARRVWDMVINSGADKFELWWPGNLSPAALWTYQYGVTQNLFAGATPEQARKQTSELFANWRQQNPAELKIYNAYKRALAETAGVDPA